MLVSGSIRLLILLVVTVIFHWLQSEAEKVNANAYGMLPHGKAFRNVRDFGAKGDGVSDDTLAFINALDYGVGTVGEKAHGTVYVPPGIYRITDTLILWKGTHLVGDSDHPPTLVLPSHTKGFDDPSNPKPLIVTANGWGIDPKTRDWRTRLDTKGGSTNNTFYTSLRNIKVKIEQGNQGAIGIYWCVAQGTSLRNVTIYGGDAYACLKTSLWGGGGVIANIKVQGGQRGWEVDQTSQFLVRSAKFYGQSRYAIRLAGVWNFVFIDLEICDVPSGMKIEGGNCISLLDCSFRAISDGSAIKAEPMPHSLFLQNVHAKGLKEVVKGYLPANGKPIGRWVWSRNLYRNGKAIDFPYRSNERYQRLPSHEFPKITRKARSVTEFGAFPDDGKDDTKAIQSAIDKCDELFFPSGRYEISGTLRLRPHTKIFGEHPATIYLRPQSPYFDDPENPKPMIETPDEPSSTVTLVNLFLVIDEALKGAYHIEWRAGEKSKMMDVYLYATSNQPFVWRISGNGGGFFENLWWPAGYAIKGKTGAIVTSNGRKWFYSWQHEHYDNFPIIFRKASKTIICLVQFEDDYPASMWLEDCEDISIYGAISGNWREMRPTFIQLDGGRRIELFSLNWLGAHHGVLTQKEISGQQWFKTKPDVSQWSVIGAWMIE